MVRWLPSFLATSSSSTLPHACNLPPHGCRRSRHLAATSNRSRHGWLRFPLLSGRCDATEASVGRAMGDGGGCGGRTAIGGTVEDTADINGGPSLPAEHRSGSTAWPASRRGGGGGEEHTRPMWRYLPGMTACLPSIIIT